MASGRKLPEVPDDLLRELAEIAHYPLEVLKQALLTGIKPRLVLLLRQIAGCVVYPNL
jgi:hypothetical protein